MGLWLARGGDGYLFWLVLLATGVAELNEGLSDPIFSSQKAAKSQGFLQGLKIYFICLLPCIFVFLLWELSIMGSRWNLAFIGFLLC